MRNAFLLIFSGMTLCMAASVMSQQPTPACDAAGLPAGMGRWCTRQPVQAAANTSELAAASLQIGTAYAATLKSTADVRYVSRPEKSGGSASFGGLFSFRVADGGTYRVALSSGAWIDLLEDGKAVISTTHGHGPEGSGIRKMVEFPLAPGRHTLQIAANGEAALTLMIVRLP